MRDVVEVLLDARWPGFPDEQLLQDVAATLLEHEGYTVEREVRLNARDRIDLLVGDVGIECKIAGQPAAVLRQLERYAEHDLSRIVLLTRAAQHLYHMPTEVGGKPLSVVFTSGHL